MTRSAESVFVSAAWRTVVAALLYVATSASGAFAQEQATPEQTTPEQATPEQVTPEQAAATPTALELSAVPPATRPALSLGDGLAPKGPVSEPAAEQPPAHLAPPPKTETAWYERLKIRGYTQFRYNRLPSFDENDDLVNDQGDKTLGRGNGFSIRRARVILYGDIHERVSIYLQPDFASTINDQLHTVIFRDWYTDLFLTKDKSLRLRVGQSKVPYGFENMQSSQNRLSLDRNDALNSAVKDERDIGVFMYWAPPKIRERFKYLVDNNLKGSGDYGVLGLGVYNGQTANRPAVTDDQHVIGRVTWPFLLGSQFMEVGGGGYYGKYSVTVRDRDGLTYRAPDGTNIVDSRAFASFVLYPQPFGFQAEATYGVGPAQGRRGDEDRYDIKSRKLYGGYAQVMWKFDDVFGTTSLIPYARATYYLGGKKFETNAPRYLVKELELGVEWQIMRALEVVLAYDIAERTSSRFPYKMEAGHVTRVQVQVNY